MTLAAAPREHAETAAATEDLRVQTAAQKASLSAKLADLKVAKAQLKVLQAETKKQLALQKLAYQKLAQNKVRPPRSWPRRRRPARAQEADRQPRRGPVRRRQHPVAVYNGTFIWPIHGTSPRSSGAPASRPSRRSAICAHFHNGIDIADPMYTPIHAAGAGRVVYDGPLSDGAWVVIIAHSTDLVTWYGHSTTGAIRRWSRPASWSSRARSSATSG